MINHDNGKHSYSLAILILLGVAAGFGLGGLYPDFGKNVQFVGDLFLRALLMLVVPIVITSLISGVAQLGDVRKLGGIAGKTIGFFVATTLIAATIGVVMVTTINPGATAAVKDDVQTQEQQVSEKRTADQTFGDVFNEVLLNLVPENIFKAMIDNNLLPIILVSLIFGAVLTTLGARGQVVIDFFVGTNLAIMKIVDLLMLVAPLGIGALVAGRIGAAGGFAGFGEDLNRLGGYTAVVVAGLILQGCFVLPMILYFFAKPRNGIAGYFRGMTAALITSFSTASSAATLPVTMRCAIQSGISNRTASFVLPLGVTLNMNGTALYEAVAAIFIAQISNIVLMPWQLVIVAGTAALAAIGAAAIPEAGLVTMIIVLKAVNLPTESIALLLMVDWFLDRCRTTVNVWGDCVGAAVIDRFEAAL